MLNDSDGIAYERVFLEEIEKFDRAKGVPAIDVCAAIVLRDAEATELLEKLYARKIHCLNRDIDENTKFDDLKFEEVGSGDRL